MTPLERLLAEELPTGNWGNGPAKRSSRRAAAPGRKSAKADPMADAHRAQLLAALDEKPLRVGRRARPHLAVVPPAA